MGTHGLSYIAREVALLLSEMEASSFSSQYNTMHDFLQRTGTYVNLDLLAAYVSV